MSTRPTGSRPRSGRSREHRLDPDELADLEEQRAFLLRSLADLEAEHDAGDLDDADYEALKDDYTARAAAVLRAVEDRKARFAEARPARSPLRLALAVGGVVLLAVVAGLLVARASGVRDADDEITGGDSALATRDQLVECQGLAAEGEALESIRCYDAVLEAEPENVEALTYRGWVLVLAGLFDEAQPYFDQAIALDPDYPDVRAFQAVSYARQGRTDEAEAAIEAFEATDPPAAMAQLVEGLRAQLEAGGADGAGVPAAPTTTAPGAGEGDAG